MSSRRSPRPGASPFEGDATLECPDRRCQGRRNGLVVSGWDTGAAAWLVARRNGRQCVDRALQAEPAPGEPART